MSRPAATGGRPQVEDIYPLTPLQHGLLFHSLYDPESGVYAEQFGYALEGDFDGDAFRRAWQHVLDRHSILRTAFVTQDLKEPLQLVRPQVDLPWIDEDWRDVPSEEQQSRWDTLLTNHRQQAFALARAPLMRMALVRFADDRYKFVWTFHHVLLDGWSVALVLREVQMFYEGFRSEGKPTLPRPRPFRDFIAWLKAQDKSAAESFWRNRLEGFEAPTSLGVDRARVLAEGEPEYSEEQVHLSKQQTADLQALARKHDFTLNTVVQGAWAILLSRYAGTKDVVYGTTTSGRPPALPGAESMIGLFINMLPVRLRVSDEGSLISLLKTLQGQQVDQREFEYAPLVDIHGWSDVPRTSPLFESAFVFENYPVQPFSGDGDAELSVTRDDYHSRTNYPLTVLCAPGEELEIGVAYDRSRFDPASIARLLAHFQQLLAAMPRDPDRPLGELSLLPPEEEAQLLVDWNETEHEFAHQGTIHGLVEAQVARTPDAVALATPDDQLTYRELNARANKLARYLGTLGVGPEVRVGLCMNRSAEMVVGILGILKAGGNYVAIDPEYPSSRVAFIIADSNAAVLLAETPLLDRLPEHDGKTVCLDADAELIAAYSSADPCSPVGAGCLSHVIYTSGSTGIPKGVAIEHRAVTTLVQWSREHYTDAELAGVLAATSVCFDLSVWELFVPLSWGGTVVLAENALALLELPAADRVTLVNTVPSAIAALLRQDGVSPSVQTVNLAGEPLTTRLADSIYALGSIRRVCDLYGPSEDTTYSTYAQREPGGLATIGRPLANTRAYLRDSSVAPVPIGVPGELYLGGEGLARGYHDRSDLTAERFVPDPYSQRPGSRVYRTGDLLRWLPDGTLEFLGRIDHQVKIRGYRIELGEVEAVLAGFAGVRDVVAMARDDRRGDKRLVVYMTGAGDALTEPEIRRHAEERLPGYMVPGSIVILDALPLTPNGKIDRSRLPEPDEATSADDFVAPRTAYEEILADVWVDVLQVERVGADDDFFVLGGHSLLATQLVGRLAKAFGIELPLRTLFEHPTVSALAREIELVKQGGESVPTLVIHPSERNEEVSLSFAQERLWFLDELSPGDSTYVIPSALRLRGPLQIPALAAAHNEVVRRHESLRTVFSRTPDGRPVQHIVDDASLSLDVVDLRGMSAGAVQTTVRRLAMVEAQRPFDLAVGPLVRGTLLRLADEEHVALFSVHHIVTDGWSTALFVQEISALYATCAEGGPSLLVEPALQYADYAVWQRDWLEGGALEIQLDYWKDRLAGAPELLEVPTDRPRPAIQSTLR